MTSHFHQIFKKREKVEQNTYGKYTKFQKVYRPERRPEQSTGTEMFGIKILNQQGGTPL